MLDEIGNVVCHDGDKRSIIPGLRSQPVGQLIIPHKIVAAHFLLVLLGDVNDNLAASVVKHATLRLSVLVLKSLELTRVRDGSKRTFM